MKATLIGAGNLATQLGRSLKERNVEILQVFSRTEESATALGEKLNAEYTTAAGEIREGADFYIYSLKDDALEEVIGRVNANSGIHIHTAGSVDMDVFKGKKARYGVMYPMQTFSKQKKVDFSKIPIFIEGSDRNAVAEIRHLSEALSDSVTECDSQQRMTLHLGAVFCCNYSNYMCSVTEKLLNDKGLDFSVMLPLIDETIGKLHTLSPKDAQTGPASREDYGVMEKHVNALAEYPEYRELYKKIAEGIINRNKQ